MHDKLIRGGAAVDGTGKTAHTATLLALSVEERMKRRQDPSFSSSGFIGGAFAAVARPIVAIPSAIATRWNRMFLMGEPQDYEPEKKGSIAAMPFENYVLPGLARPSGARLCGLSYID